MYCSRGGVGGWLISDCANALLAFGTCPTHGAVLFVRCTAQSSGERPSHAVHTRASPIRAQNSSKYFSLPHRRDLQLIPSRKKEGPPSLAERRPRCDPPTRYQRKRRCGSRAKYGAHCGRAQPKDSIVSAALNRSDPVGSSRFAGIVLKTVDHRIAQSLRAHWPTGPFARRGGCHSSPARTLR